MKKTHAGMRLNVAQLWLDETYIFYLVKEHVLNGFRVGARVRARVRVRVDVVAS